MSADPQDEIDPDAPEAAPGPDEPPGFDATMRAVILFVAGSAAGMTVLALLAFGARSALGVAIGGAIATANLYMLARIVDAFISRRGNTVSWVVIAVLKMVVLLGGIWFLVKEDFISVFALMFGYASLVVGITLGTLFGPKPPEEPGAGGSSAPR